MKVLLIDPWGTRNTAEYLNGLIFGLSENVDLTVFTNCYADIYIESDATIIKRFFKISERLPQSWKIRKIIRGFEYIQAYRKIILLARNDHYDIVHINWLLKYDVDIKFIKEIKKYCNKIVYTAHNAIPHINGEQSIAKLTEIYNEVDEIIVHGESIKKELCDIFLGIENKVHIQRHGCILRERSEISEDWIPSNILEKIIRYSKVFLCCGAIFPNKGTDRLLKLWLENHFDEDAILIIAGRKSTSFTEFDSLNKQVKSEDNIIILDEYVDEKVMNGLINKANAIVLPYRHASMSGVIFTAAWFSKTVICTDVGSIAEYLEPEQDSLVCGNSSEELNRMINIAIKMDSCDLEAMGIRLNKNICSKCDWNAIGKSTVTNIYI